MRISHEAIYQALFVQDAARSSVNWSHVYEPAERYGSRAPAPGSDKAAWSPRR